MNTILKYNLLGV